MQLNSSLKQSLNHTWNIHVYMYFTFTFDYHQLMHQNFWRWNYMSSVAKHCSFIINLQHFNCLHLPDIGWKTSTGLLALIVLLWKSEKESWCFIAPSEHEVYFMSTILLELGKLLHHGDYKKSFQFPEAGSKRLTLLIHLHWRLKGLECFALQPQIAELPVAGN